MVRTAIFGTIAALALCALPGVAANPTTGQAVVSVDLLRHPVRAKVRQQILKAMEKMESGDHEAAIGMLYETLAKYPDSAPYVYSLLGVEYVKTDRYQAGVNAMEQAVSLLPHDPMTHYNFGLALIAAGDYDRASQEVQRALELDPNNPAMRRKLDALQARKRSVD